jgi:hypothetical protein
MLRLCSLRQCPLAHRASIPRSVGRTAENCSSINHSGFSVSDNEFDRLANVAVLSRFPLLCFVIIRVGQSFGVTLFGSGLSPNHALDFLRYTKRDMIFSPSIRM